MSESFDQLLQQLFNAPQLRNLTVEELKNLTNQYPFFSAAQLLLLKKMDPQTDDFRQQKQKAALHIYNPLQLEAIICQAEPLTVYEAPLQEADVIKIESQTGTEDTVEERQEPTEETSIKQDNLLEQAIEQDLVNNDPFIEADEQAKEPEIIESDQEENFVNRETVVVPQEGNDQNAAPKITEEVRLENVDNSPAPVTTLHSQPDVGIPELAPITIRQPEADESTALAFEPFHTVDYFASQGIKLSQQETGNDRFGKQLKSFTEWLKTMKKLPVAEQASPVDGAGEKKVENLAAHSLQNTDVITESMAEVWLKQGNREKAIEVYNKLSLHNPSKRAYFAAKIDSLKKPN